jgi:aspartate carbamoyltransferase catalytic subunit
MAKRDLISMEDLSRDQVELLLDTAESFLPVLERDIKKVPTLRGRTIINLFWEASTRTSSSFDLAAKRLSADTLGLKAKGLGRREGRVAQGHRHHPLAYGPDIIVMRHPSAGACQILSRTPRPASSTPATASTSTRRSASSTSSACARPSAATSPA